MHEAPSSDDEEPHYNLTKQQQQMVHDLSEKYHTNVYKIPLSPKERFIYNILKKYEFSLL
jgi:hypothetical protein